MMDATPTGNNPRDVYTRPQTPARIGLAVIVLFAGTMTAWSAFAPLSDAAVAQGSLQVVGRRQTVQHPYGGVVKALKVSEGDRVEKGQVLITLSDTEPRSNLEVLAAEKMHLAARRARLLAERDGVTLKAVPEGSTEAQRQAMASERAILEARNRQHESSLNIYRSRIGQLRETITGAQSGAGGLQRQTSLVEDELKGARSLLEKGLTPRPRVLGLERQISELNAALAAKRSDIAAAKEAIAEAEAEIAKLDRTRLTSIADDLNAVDGKLAEVEPKIESARDILRRTQIVAPATGRVVALSVFTEGGVIQQGSPLMEIVPSDTPFFVDARLQVDALHGIEAGQQADIQFLSVPRNERPEIRGTVETVSADRLVDERSGQAYYALQVRLDKDDVARSGVDLHAGMPAQVVMPTKARTLIGYLTSPLLDRVTTAFREH